MFAPGRTDPDLLDMPIVYASDAFLKLTGGTCYSLFFYLSANICSNIFLVQEFISLDSFHLVRNACFAIWLDMSIDGTLNTLFREA